MDFFHGMRFHILPLGIAPKRVEFFTEQIRKRGGGMGVANASHVIIESGVGEACLRGLRGGGPGLRSGVSYLSADWLSRCLKEGRVVGVEGYEIGCVLKAVKEEGMKGSRGEVDLSSLPPLKKTKLEQDVDTEKFLCSQSSSTSAQTQGSFNQSVISELQRLVEIYQVRNDSWRVFGYQKTIAAITRHPRDIQTFEEARDIPGVGKKMALKVMEILELGSLRKTRELSSDEKSQTLKLFEGVWGAGLAAAEAWYQLGFRTLEDLETKAKLTRQQSIGLKYYSDIQLRIPRSEVVAIAALVELIVQESSGLSMQVVGSFRRGKESCGDIDVMIVSEGGLSSIGDVLNRVTDRLKEIGLLTADLVTLSTPHPHQRYMGLCRLTPASPHRRIDLFVVPRREVAAALLHYTGSAMFNRSARLLAARKGMSLSEHGLYQGTVRKGMEILSEGQLVPTETEEDIFKHLGLEYKPPEERDH